MERSVVAFTLLFILVAGVVAGADEVDLSKLRLKEIRRMLDERSVECRGCVEKDHFLDVLRENIHLPVLSEEERAAKKAEKEGQKEQGSASKKEKLNFDDIDGPDEYFERLKKILGENNLGDGMKMFKREDLEKMADFKSGVDHRGKFDGPDEF